MEAALRGSNKVTAYCASVRQLASRLRVLSSHYEQPTLRVEPVQKITAVQQNIVLGNKQFPFPGNVAMTVTHSQVMQQKVSNPIEMNAIECPDAMKKKVHDLFPGQDLKKVSVLNLMQKTENDMSEWSAKMEIEWMAASSGFIESAVETCNALRSLGYWADFIDPSSGKPYLSGQHTDATLDVTDDEFRSLGFDVKDMGCCKVVSHKMWGKNVFVGTIFTNAPVNSSAVSEILAQVNVH